MTSHILDSILFNLNLYSKQCSKFPNSNLLTEKEKETIANNITVENLKEFQTVLYLFSAFGQVDDKEVFILFNNKSETEIYKEMVSLFKSLIFKLSIEDDKLFITTLIMSGKMEILGKLICPSLSNLNLTLTI